MSGLIAKPLDEVQQYVATTVEELKSAGDPSTLHLALSIAEYLRDAARWHCVRDTVVPGYGRMGPDELQKHVDAQIARAK